MTLFNDTPFLIPPRPPYNNPLPVTKIFSKIFAIRGNVSLYDQQKQRNGNAIKRPRKPPQPPTPRRSQATKTLATFKQWRHNQNHQQQQNKKSLKITTRPVQFQQSPDKTVRTKLSNSQIHKHHQ